LNLNKETVGKAEKRQGTWRPRTTSNFQNFKKKKLCKFAAMAHDLTIADLEQTVSVVQIDALVRQAPQVF